MKLSWLALTLALALALVLGGCTVSRDTSLVLAEPDLRLKRGGAENVGIKVSVSDVRADKTSIGTVQNTPSQIKYNLVATQPIELAVEKGVIAEFRSRGFRMADGPPFLLVDVEKADSLMNGGAWDVRAHCSLAGKVVDADGRTLYSKTYAQSDRGKTDDDWAGFDSGPVKLQKVLAIAIRDMGDDDRLAQALFEANRRR